MSKARKTFCPVHGTQMVRTETQYGPRYDCPAPSCTTMCWGGATSTPADQVTRDARHACHAALDPLWKGSAAVMNRSEAYRFLAQVMGVKQKYAHIGMADLQQCKKILANVAEIHDAIQDTEPTP